MIYDNKYKKHDTGIIRILKAQFNLKDCDISNIIKHALVEKGYDLEATPIEDKNNYIVGENIKVFEVIIPSLKEIE